MATLNFYKDLSLDFTPHPVSGDVRPIVDDLAIRRSITNLIRTSRGSRPFYPEYGCTISSLLFSNADVFTKNTIKDSVYDALSKFEPRIDVISVEPTFDDDNGVSLQIRYKIKNTSIVSSITTTVKRAA
jgi:phage baseplate assembly protein W